MIVRLDHNLIEIRLNCFSDADQSGKFVTEEGEMLFVTSQRLSTFLTEFLLHQSLNEKSFKSAEDERPKVEIN